MTAHIQNGRRLVVYVPGLGRRTEEWNPLVERLRSEEPLAGATWLPWDHGCGIFTPGRALDKSLALRAAINEAWIADGGYDDILLIGHSIGGLLVRAAYLLAAGRLQGSQAEPILPWVDRVSRVVLFASINRGIDPERSWRVSGFRQSYRIARVFRLIPRLLLMDLFRGADFLTELRVEWIRHFRRSNESSPSRLPHVVQVLGTDDWVVKREDSVDLLQCPDAYYIDVPDADHGKVYRLDVAPDPERRYRLLRYAIIGSLTAPQPTRPPAERNPVVFAVHGIRASNSDWPHDVRNLIMARAPNAEVLIPSYGRFSALSFALPWVRRRNIPWLKAAYAEARARHPDADFYYLGHSNGTYLLGRALLDLPRSMRFERVTFVGSVLPRDYDWQTRLTLGQVSELRNHRSQWDWPVAWLCSGLRGLLMRDIGTAGFDGFNYGGPQLSEWFYYHGGHGRPLEDDNLPGIVGPLLTGVNNPLPVGSPLPTRSNAVWAFISRVMPFAAGPLVVLLGWGLWKLWSHFHVLSVAIPVVGSLWGGWIVIALVAVLLVAAYAA